MKTKKVSTIRFSSKQHFVNKKQLELVREISKKMCGQSAMRSTENKFTASYINAVKTGECLLYSDTFLYGKNENTSLGTIGKTQIEFDNKTIAIDNKTGEITKIQKPWYSSVRSILKKMDKYLENINSNFENQDVVTKKTLNIHGFTPKGLNKIMSGEISIDFENGGINV